MKKTFTTCILALGALSIATAADARDGIRMVGSSTVFPFTSYSAENFSNTSGMPTPIIESTGTGGGMKLFCAGVGVDTPDATGASRKMKDSEVALCNENGVTDISQILLGYDGIVVANSVDGADFDLATEDLYMALAANVPVNGELVPNPYTTWDEIRPDLPMIEIRVFGPPPTSGTRDAFQELVLEHGAELMGVADMGLSKEEYKAASTEIRADGAYIEAGENDNLIVQRLTADTDALGIFGYSFLEENLSKVKGAVVDGVTPEFDNIASGEYPISRSMYIYVKNEHKGVVPGLQEFQDYILSDAVSGPEGFLVNIGLIPVVENRDSMVTAVE